MTKNDVIEIKCKKCGGVHKYLMDVTVSNVIYNLSVSIGREPVEKIFTRLFTCPRKNEDFQATFSLVENFGTIIRDAEIEGVIDEDTEES